MADGLEEVISLRRWMSTTSGRSLNLDDFDVAEVSIRESAERSNSARGFACNDDISSESFSSSGSDAETISLPAESLRRRFRAWPDFIASALAQDGRGCNLSYCLRRRWM